MQIKQYKLSIKVAEDVIGSVYKAKDSRNDRPVFMRVLHDAFVNDENLKKLFHQCAEAYCALKNVACVRALEHGEADGKHYMILEYHKLKPLQEVLKQHSVFSVEESLAIVKNGAAQLRGAHRMAVVHGSLSPQNTFVDMHSHEVLISDFEFEPFIAALIARRHPDIIDLLPYYAPEYIQGKTKYDRRIDIYSLAAILYRMLVGNVPHKAENISDYLTGAYIQSFVPPTLKRLDMPDYLDDALAEALQYDMNKRVVHMSDLIKRLEEPKPGEPLTTSWIFDEVDVDDAFEAEIPAAKPPFYDPPFYKKLKSLLLPFAILLLVSVSFILILNKPQIFRRNVQPTDSKKSGEPGLTSHSEQPVTDSGDVIEKASNEFPEPLRESELAVPKDQETVPFAKQEEAMVNGQNSGSRAYRSADAGRSKESDNESRITDLEEDVKSQINRTNQTVLNELDALVLKSRIKLELHVEINGMPLGANVFVNGQFSGKTDDQGSMAIENLETDLPYLIRVQKEGFEMWAKELTYQEPGFKTLTAELKPVRVPEDRSTVADLPDSNVGLVTILLSNPERIENAFVYVNGRLWQGKPKTVPLRLGLKRGEYTIEIRKQGYQAEPFRKEVSLDGGENETIYFYLIPQN